MVTFVGYQTAPEFYQNEELHRRKIAVVANQAMAGKLNAVSEITLTANVGTTTVTDARLSVNSYLGLMPKTANAAAALATTYIADATKKTGSCVITHANNAQTDKTFQLLIIG